MSLGNKFIVLDGGEGCGKSTQAQLLKDALEKSSVPTLLVRDPGSTRIGEMIRKILLDPDHGDFSMRCEMLLYMAARAQLVKELIAPALAEGKCVICDRFVSSTLAYQLGGDGLTETEIRQAAGIAIANRWPDLTIILDMPVEQSAQRLQRARDRIEQRPTEYHQGVRQNYLTQAQKDPAKVKVCPADRERAAVHLDILKILETLK